VVIGAASTGSFRRFERVAMTLCFGSLILIPIALVLHPGAGPTASGFLIPTMPGGAGQLSTVMLLVIGMVGTTVAPWQLFFQQSYVIDKRITTRFLKYEKADLWIGIVIVVVGATAIIGFADAATAGTHAAGHFTDTAGLAAAVAAKSGHLLGILCAIALLDASVIGAFAVSLSTAYAIGDVCGVNHSLHRGVKQAKGFYGVYVGVIGLAAGIVLIPNAPLGLITNGVQAMAGVLLPSASVFLLLLCNDKEVLGPWVNGRRTNLFTSTVLGVLVMLSVVLTASVLFPSIGAGQILGIMGGCLLAGLGVAGYALRRRGSAVAIDRAGAEDWQMPPLAELGKTRLSAGKRIGMGALRGYLVVSALLVIVKVVELSVGAH